MRATQESQLTGSISCRAGRRPALGARVHLALLATLAAAAINAAPASAGLRAGDVGFSINSSQGPVWVYGDSWIDNRFIRNAITLSGHFTGEIKGVPAPHWVWPGAPFKLPDGRLAMYGSEMMQATPGIWGFKTVRGIRTAFKPNEAWKAPVTPMPSGPIWASEAIQGPTSTLVYSTDGLHRALVGRPNADGSVTQLGVMGGSISGQYSVLTDADGKWWLVGQLPFLSRRVVAYPLSGPAGKVTGSALPLATLPNPGSTRFTYAANVHPELSGLLTWAVNGSGPGTPYGLQRINGFWPKALEAAITLRSGSAAKARVAYRPRASAAGLGKKILTWAQAKRYAVELQNQITTQDEAMKIENKVEESEGWLSPPPEPLDPGQQGSPSSPATREYAGKGRKAPKGEDDTSDRQAGLRIAAGRQKVSVGEDRTKDTTEWADLTESLSKLPDWWTSNQSALDQLLAKWESRKAKSKGSGNGDQGSGSGGWQGNGSGSGDGED